MLQSSWKMTFSIIDFAVRHGITRFVLRNKSKVNCAQEHLAGTEASIKLQTAWPDEEYVKWMSFDSSCTFGNLS